MSKTLYVVPTPIGNLKDITYRGKEILQQAVVILCEDTKVTGKLKQEYNSEAKLISLHKFNEASRVKEVISLLEDEQEGLIALVSDAGTPTISDPGQLLIKELKEAGYDICPVPGANAITTALSGSGLEFSSFSFVGFLDKTEKKIIDLLEKHINNDVIVAYESPNRIKQTLAILADNYGDIEVVIARELTKMYEEIVKGTISELMVKEYKGEIVLLIPTIGLRKELDLSSYIDPLLIQGMTDKSIVNYLSETTTLKKNDIYEYLKNKV